MKTTIESHNPWRSFTIGAYYRFFFASTYHLNMYRFTTPYGGSVKSFIGEDTDQAVLNRYGIFISLLDGDYSVQFK